MPDDKEELRVAAKARRKAAAAQMPCAASNLAQHIKLIERISTDLTPVISAYFPIGDELDPRPVMEALALRMAGTLCLPVMIAPGKPLLFRAWGPGEETVKRMWGIREPQPDAPEVVPDLLFVPLLAIDRQGYRLGYGGGFYDRTIAKLRKIKRIIAIGVAYDEQVVDAVPHAAYDEPVDYILTPSGFTAASR